VIRSPRIEPKTQLSFEAMLIERRSAEAKTSF